ncbi:MAG: MMPL family transporter [Alteromonadaceae bacterium]|nr:MMPL family transporter [Alteromonadaceae bacterium]
MTSISTPVQMIPDLDVRTITVQTGWAGATPQDIEKEILIEQERYLRNLPNLQRMVSYAEMGQANIELEFPFGVDVNDALIRVNNALSQVVSYPDNVDQPRLFSSSFSSNAFMYFALKPLPGNPLQLDMDMLRDFAEDYVRPRMESVAGVSEVGVGGATFRQIQIKVDAAKLAQRGITLSEIRDVIRERNRDASAGDIESGKNRYLIRVIGRFEQLDEIRNLEIKRLDDVTVYLRDVASVELDHFEKRSMSYFDGQRNLMLSVRRESGSNVIDIKTQMLPIIDDLNQNLLRQNGLEIVVSGDDVQYVQDSLKNVGINLALGALLATAVMFFFLRSGRATLVGVLGIPLCTLAAFVALNLTGRTINVISMAGVAFAIGMTVDNTIVVLDSIIQACRKGASRLEGTIEGVKRVWPAVLASTATTVMVFAPILFVQEEAGQLYSDIAIAISGAIIASMLVAVLVVPVAILHLTRNNELTVKSSNQWQQKGIRLVEWFVKSKSFARISAAAMAAGLLILAVVMMPAAEYLPEGEEPKAFSMMIAPPDYNLSQMQEIGDELRVYFNEFVKEDATTDSSNGMPPLNYYMMSVSVGRIWFLSAPKEPELIGDMMDAITEKFRSYDDMRAFSSRGSIISSNDGGSRAVAIDISGSNMVDLYRAAEGVYQQAEQTFDNPQINSNPGSLTLNQPLIEINPRWQRLDELGIGNRDFGYTVAALSDGAFVDEFILKDDKVDIFLFSGAGSEQSIEQLENAPIVTPNGDVLPLKALADLVETKNSNSLRRVDGERTVTVYIIPPRDVALETAVEMVRTDLLPALWQKGDIAQGIRVDVSGAADQLQATKASLTSKFLVAVAICYLLLVAIFKHWQFPVYILATVPLGMAGGLLGLILVNGLNSALSTIGLSAFHQPFDMITMLGFLILLGTVVNNPILIVEQTRQNVIDAGMQIKEAVIAAVTQRMKPILMSTSTTILGLAPLVLVPGEGTELYRGVGVIVLSGILASMFLTLTFLPALLVGTLKESKLFQNI